MVQPGYRHTQKGPPYLLLILVAGVFGVCAYALTAEPLATVLLRSLTLVFCVPAAAFRELTVEGRGEVLLVWYGPLSFFRKQLPYSEMTTVRAARSTPIDGLGIHYLPGRGWIYNLWGADCVAIGMRNRKVRIGTDDVPGLVAFLQRRLQQSPRPE